MAENIDPEEIARLNREFLELTSISRGMGSSFVKTSDESDVLADSFKSLKQAIRKARDELEGEATGRTAWSRRQRDIEEKAREDEIKKDAEARRKKDRALADEERKEKVSRDKKDQEEKETTFKRQAEEDKRKASLIRTNQQFQSLDGIIDHSMDKFIDLNGKSAGATVGFQALGVVLKESIQLFKALYNAQISYDKAIIMGEKGQTVVARRTEEMGKAFTKFLDTLGSVSMGLGGFLLAIAPLTGGLSAVAGAALLAAGGAAKLYASVEETALEFNTLNAQLKDKLFSGFNELGKASMIGAGGMTQLKEQLNDLMLGMADVAEFTNLVKNAGKEIRMFGASTTEGVKEFVRTAGGLVRSELGKTLETMGITAQDQREHMLAFLAQEARLGRARITDQEKLNKAAYNYILEMDRLAELTGATRKEQEEARNQIMAIEELRAAQLAATDPEEKAMLDRALKNAEALYASGAKGLAAGVARYFAAGGAVTSAEAARAQMATPQLLEDIRKGNKTVAQNLIGASDELKRYAVQFAGIGRLSAEATKKIMPDTFAAISDLAIKMDKNPEEIAKMSGEELDKWLDDLRKTNDPMIKAQVELIRQQREQQTARENEVFTFKTAVNTFADAVKNFAGIKPGSGPTGTPPPSVRVAQEKNEQAKKVEELTKDKVKKLSDELAATEAALKQKDLSAKDEKELREKYKKIKDDLLKANKDATKATQAVEQTEKDIITKKRQQERAKTAIPIMERELKEKEQKLLDLKKLDDKKRDIEKEVALSTQIEAQKKKIAQYKQVAEGEAPSAGRPRASKQELEKDPLAGLDFGGKRAERTGGGQVDSKLIELAHRINEEFPGVTMTAMNDLFHQREAKNSKHTIGKALDFKTSSPPKDIAEGAAMVEQLKKMGASVVLDEYSKPSAKSTGGHFHVEVAHTGGYFKSNLGEFPVILKSGEYVLTSKMVDNLRRQYTKNVEKTPIERVFPEATVESTPRKNNEVGNFISSFMQNLKFDSKSNVSFAENVGTKPSELKYDIGNLITTFVKAQEAKSMTVENKSGVVTTKPNSEIDSMVSAVISSNESLQGKIDDMIGVLQESVSLQDKLLKYSRN